MGEIVESKSRSIRLEVRPIAGIEELRRLILEARRPAPDGSSVSVEAIPGDQRAELERLLSRASDHADALKFDLRSHVPLVGPVVTVFKRMLRRLARAYVDRQSAVNEYLLALAAVTAREQLRVSAAQAAALEELRSRSETLNSRVTDQANESGQAPLEADRGAE